jgi:hypothetical protein
MTFLLSAFQPQLSLSVERQVSLTAGPEFQHHSASEIAVSAFELATASHIRDGKENQ